MTTAYAPAKLQITPDTSLPATERPAEAKKWADRLFASTQDWAVFHRQVFGPGGLVESLYPQADELRFFQRTLEYRGIVEQLTDLRSRAAVKASCNDNTRVLTIRLPSSVYETLANESNSQALSLNQLAISKLLQPLEPRFVPVFESKRRGRPLGQQRVLPMDDRQHSADFS